MINPNSYLMANTGEAVRVYYVMASHAKTDTSYTHFQGMNFPYGENLVFCDAQPLVTESFRFVNQLFSATSNYAVGVQNALSLYSLIVGALLLFIFLLRWNLPPWYAALVAYGIMLIGPQILRMPWQPNLSYFWFIPLILLLYQKYFREQNWGSTIYIGVVTFLSFFINPYFGVISSGFFALTFALLIKSNWKSYTYYLKGLVQFLLPGIGYQLYVAITDYRVDRVEVPTGLHEFTATFSSLFTSPHSPFAGIYNALGVDETNVLAHFEGMAYVGLAGNLILLFFLVRWVIGLFYKSKVSGYLDQEKKVLLLVVIVFGILSTGFPFLMHSSLEELLSVFKPLRQMRALGRLSWVFCIGLNLILYYLIYKWFSEGKSSVLKGVVPILAVAFTGIEGVYLHQQVRKEQVDGNPFVMANVASDPTVNQLSEALSQVDTEKYSCIVPVPYFHVGSELFLTESHTSYQAMLEVLCFAYHTELPITGCYLSRNSKSESIKAFQFFAPSMIEKEIAEDFPNDQPILLFMSKNAPESGANEKRVLELGQEVYSNDQIALFEVWPDSIWATNKEEINGWYDQYKDSYNQYGDLHYYGNIQPYYFSYDGGSQEGVLGNSTQFLDQDTIVLFDQRNVPIISGDYELSFWQKTIENSTQSNLWMETLDEDGRVVETTHLYDAKRTFTFYKDWMRWKQDIQFKDDKYIRLYFVRPSNAPEIVLDELMLLPEKSSVFVLKENQRSWNNYPID